ncbi:MAG: hypothetical protein NEA02_11365 [Thermoanaerobaculia bacterium]|nr:hypothetical protein [Thermoanaerobaculia bacterium]
MKTPTALLRLVSAAAFAAILAAAVALPAAAQVDLTRIAFVGDSEGAGFSSGCLTKRVQVDSPIAIIARTANVADFQQPIVNDPGLGNCMVLTSLAPSFGGEAGNGTPANLAVARPYNNLSIPGCAIGDMVRATTGAETASAGACRSFIDLVLRNSALHIGSPIAQAVALNPTFVFLENVGNDYLGAVLSGTVIDGVTVTPLAPFTADINTALTTLKSKQPKGLVFGVADVTSIPFATTLPPYLTSGGKLVLVGGAPISLLGPKGCATGVPACAIPPTTLVTLNAAAYLPSGFGIPCAVAPTLPNCNKPLPAAAIDATHPGALIYAADVAFLKQRGTDYNTAIKAAATASGYKYYDVNDFLLRLKAGFNFGGATINAAFLSGGAFSYDGFHLTPIGYALLADDVIQFMNANFGASIPRVNLSAYLFAGGTNGGLSGPFTGSYVWAPMNDAEKATAIEQIFTLDFASQLASMFSFSKPALVQGDGGLVPRVERHHRGPEQP